MRLRSFLFALFLTVTGALAARGQTSTATLAEVASFPTQQVTGVAVSWSGRIFVNFPDWSDDHTTSVAEIGNGKPKPFPNDDWNKAPAPGDHFVCVQNLFVDESDSLWILDPARRK